MISSGNPPAHSFREKLVEKMVRYFFFNALHSGSTAVCCVMRECTLSGWLLICIKLKSRLLYCK